MKKNFGTKTVLAPLPVLIIATYDEQGTPDAMNAAWGGQCGPHHVALNLSPKHKTTENIQLKGAFTVSVADADHAVECAGMLSKLMACERDDGSFMLPDDPRKPSAPRRRELVERFIEDADPWIDCEDDGKHQTPLLSSRQLRCRDAGIPFEAEELERSIDPTAPLLPFEP